MSSFHAQSFTLSAEKLWPRTTTNFFGLEPSIRWRPFTWIVLSTALLKNYNLHGSGPGSAQTVPQGHAHICTQCKQQEEAVKEENDAGLERVLDRATSCFPGPILPSPTTCKLPTTPTRHSGCRTYLRQDYFVEERGPNWLLSDTNNQMPRDPPPLLFLLHLLHASKSLSNQPKDNLHPQSAEKRAVNQLWVSPEHFSSRLPLSARAFPGDPTNCTTDKNCALFPIAFDHELNNNIY